MNSSGHLYVSSGGVATSTTVNDDGYLGIYGGGKHNGLLTIANGATVSAYAGSVIDFDISGVSPGNTARVNNLSLIGGSPDYTVTVSATQVVGTYRLAGGAAGFDRIITISSDTGDTLGVISVGGELDDGRYIYSLALVKGVLSLTVADITPPEAPTASADITGPTNGSVTVTATFSADTATKQYSLNGDTWQNCTAGVVMSVNGMVYFRGIDAAGNISNVTGCAVTNIAHDRVGIFSGNMTSASLVSATGVMIGKSLGKINNLMVVYSGGTANSTSVNSHGSMYVSNGGVANSTTVNSAGYLYIYSGGVANSTAVNRLGYLYVYRGGMANSTTVSSGTLRVYSGGTMNSTTVNSSGYLYVSSGGVANKLDINSYGFVRVYRGGSTISANVNGNGRTGGNLTVSSGGAVFFTAVKNIGYLYVSSAGVANNTILNSNGYLWISSGGAASSTIVNGNGYLYVSSGGKVTGMLTLASGAVVSAYAGSIIDFDVSAVAAGSEARVNNLSLVRGTPNYTVTVAAKQAEGAYALADGAVGFDRTITVGTDAEAALGTLSVGETFTVANVNYTLALEGGTLSLGIAFDVTPSAYAEALTEDTAAVVYGSDLAARWTADTSAPGAVTLITSDFGGDAWLDIDGSEVAGALYGASCDYSGTVNIAAKSGSIRNLAAGATAGGSVGAVNLTFAGADLDGTGYAGGFGNVAGEVDTVITSGTFAKDFYAGALANKLTTATGVGDITTTISGGTFSGNIFGASAVKTDTAKGNGTRHTAGDVTLTVTGGSTTKGTQACIFAGGYATGNATGTVYTVGSVTATISGGSWGDAAGGRGVFGGIMASGVTAEAGDVNLTISGGSMGNVYGGGWAQKGGASVVGNVNITISGGTVANVFGGGSHSTSGGTTKAESVAITVSGGSISGAIYANGLFDGDTVIGESSVTFTGSGDYGCGVFGYNFVGGSGQSDVLTFAGYTGRFAGPVGGFDNIVFAGSTAMTLETAADGVSNSHWLFDVSERSAGLAGMAMLDWDDADFTGDTVTLNLTSGSVAEWTLIDAAATTVYNEFELLVDNVSQGVVALGEQIADGDFVGWGFVLDDSALKFRPLA